MSLPEGETRDLIIRPMLAEDAEAVIALERETPSAPHWNPQEYLRIAAPEENSALTRIGLVAVGVQGIDGFAVVRMLRTDESGEAELESIVVRAELRGRGIGVRLLAAVMKAARGKGAERLEFEVRASNEGAIRFYEHAGMRVDGRRSGYYADPADDAVLMSAKV